MIFSAIISILILLSPRQVQSLSITKPISYTQGFKEDVHWRFFKFTNFSSIDGNALQLTPDNENRGGYYNKSGRVTYYKPFELWSGSTVASFNTTFVVNIYRNTVWNPGEGLAFVISPGFDVPPESHGQWLGLTNAVTDRNVTNGIVAVEFDTEKQEFDPDDNHVGLNVNSVHSVKTASMTDFGFQLSPQSGTDYRVWIGYNGQLKVIEVYIANRTDVKPGKPVLAANLDLRDHVSKRSYFGFSASTGDPGIQYNCVLEWELQIESLSDGDQQSTRIAVAVGVSSAVLVLVAAAVAARFGCVYAGKKKRDRDEESNVVGALKRLPGLPREFRFKDLKRGTEDFNETRVLGRGGFGVVYKGILREKDDTGYNSSSKYNNIDPQPSFDIVSNVSGNISGSGRSNEYSISGGTEVAVKMFSRDDIKSKDDFLAELTIIHRLRHKHLVRLLGWCYEKKKLLLVYDYMPNGSLDKHLYASSTSSPVLSWQHRRKILAGVASALQYLHNDFDQKVVHRDLKASNVLLDSAFNARLGDFGLARAIDDERNSYADLGAAGVPGTMGYVAPECFHTGKATPESDVFGFGALLLEVLCARPPVGDRLTLVDWVWSLHRDRRLLHALDRRLAGEFDPAEADRLLLLGLACSNPVADERPRAVEICQIIAETLPAPVIPPFKPVFRWPTLGAGFDFSSLESDLSLSSRSVGNVESNRLATM